MLAGEANCLLASSNPSPDDGMEWEAANESEGPNEGSLRVCENSLVCAAANRGEEIMGKTGEKRRKKKVRKEGKSS